VLLYRPEDFRIVLNSPQHCQELVHGRRIRALIECHFVQQCPAIEHFAHICGRRSP
jgi:hypothetical protein